MAGGFMIMALVDNGLFECVIQENVYMFLVGEDTLRNLPVG